MALKLIRIAKGIFQYEAYSGGTGGRYVYNKYLITPPRQYVESIKSIKQFFYDPVLDKYVTFMLLDYAFWPGWRHYRLVFSGNDGALDSSYPRGATLLFSHWTNHISVGGYNRFYATGNSFINVREVDWVKQQWLSWSCNDWPGHPIFNQALVNRTDKLLVGNDLSIVFSVYNYTNGTLVGKIISPYTTLNGYMSYEDDSRFWCVYHNGQLGKYNYKTLNCELMTSVERPTADDLAYRVAFDTNRKRVAILRHQKDSTDGSCNLQIEFYYPIPAARIITSPAPVTPIIAGEEATFSCHVLGDAGEGIAATEVNAALEEPSAGRLVASKLLTGYGGGVDIGYRAPNDEAVETLTVTTEVED